MFHLNKMSQLVTVDPSLTIDEYEARLNEEGLTGGYFPISGSHATLASCLASRTPNLYFLKYGGIEGLCVGGKVATPSGEVFPIKAYPRAATGPDLRRLILGSQNLLGRFEEVGLRLFPLPERQLWGLALFNKESEAVETVRNLIGLMVAPLFVRLIDEEEGRGLLGSLQISETDKIILAFKLAGLGDFVEACREAIIKLHEGKKTFFYWPSRESETSFLDEQIVSPASYHLMQEKYSPLLGMGEGLNPDKAEKEFQKFFDHLKEV